MAGRKGDYLFKRGEVYWVRFQYPKETGLKVKQFSTGERTREEAWLAAAEQIIAHKQFMLLVNQLKRGHSLPSFFRMTGVENHKLQALFDQLKVRLEEAQSLLVSVPDELVDGDEKAGAIREKLRQFIAQPFSPEQILALITTPPRPAQPPFTTVQHADGTSSFATDEELFVNDSRGNTIAKLPNEKVIGVRSVFLSGAELRDLNGTVARKKQLTGKNDPDWQIIQDFITSEGKDETWAREASATYEHWRQVVGKSFAQADRPDGERLVRFYREEYVAPKSVSAGVAGIKSNTILKRLNYLSAPIHKHMRAKKARISFNPFLGVIAHLGQDATRKRPLSNEDLEKIDKNIDRLGREERLLYLICRHTGCRRGEAWQISETMEKGLRVIWFGSKTEQSVRRIPLPEGLLPHLPSKINGPLFEGHPKIVGKNLNRAFRRFGIEDESKTLHSFRHRAQDRLRTERCPEDIRWAILGHEKKTVAEGYGDGFAMAVLKPYVDAIGRYDEPDFVPNPDAYASESDEDGRDRS